MVRPLLVAELGEDPLAERLLSSVFCGLGVEDVSRRLAIHEFCQARAAHRLQIEDEGIDVWLIGEVLAIEMRTTA